MKIRMGARAAAAFCEALPEKLARRVAQAEARSAKAAEAVLVDLSSGTLTPRDLRRLDHPYARRHGRALVNPARINDQGGGFPEAWERGEVQAARTGTRVRVVNRSPEARWMRGTRRMLPRPVVAAAKKRIAPARRRRLREALGLHFLIRRS